MHALDLKRSQRDPARQKRERRARPRKERALVRQREARIGLLAVGEEAARKRSALVCAFVWALVWALVCARVATPLAARFGAHGPNATLACMPTPPTLNPLHTPHPLPTVEEILERAHVVALPMAVKFRGITTREALLIDGPAGWGEFSPFVEYAAPEAAMWLRAGIEAAFEGLPEAHGTVEVNGTVPAVAPEEVEAVLARFPGVRTFKVKVAEKGQSLDDDIARVNTLRQLQPEARIRVDANGGWNVQEAVAAEAALTVDGPLEYLEQPCATVQELAEVRARVATPVAADESIRRAEDPYQVVKLKAAQIGVVKQAPVGGVRNVLKLAAELGLELTVASALDTAVGIDAGLVAAKLTGSRAAGLATQRLFLEDVAPERSLIDGSFTLTRTTPDADRLHALRASAERRDWWFERVRACYPHLGA